jgi:hypothetical protein
VGISKQPFPVLIMIDKKTTGECGVLILFVEPKDKLCQKAKVTFNKNKLFSTTNLT